MDPAIVAEFFAEGNEHLDALEACLLRLETQPDDKDAIDRSFRAAHSIKGAAGFLSLGAVEKLMHAAEDLLDLLREGKATIDAHMAGVLLRAGDRCRLLLESARNGEEVAPSNVEEMVEVLRDVAAQALVRVPAPSALPPVVAAPAPAPAAPPVAAAAPSGPAVLVGRAPRVVRRPADPAPAEVSGPESQAPNEAPEQNGAAAQGFTLAPRVPGNILALPALDAVAGPPQGFTLALPESTATGAHPAMTVSAPVRPSAGVTAASASPVLDVVAAPTRVAAPNSAASGPARNDHDDATSGTIRVDVSLLDDIMNLVGELVVARNRLIQIVGEREDRTLTTASRRVDHLTSDLQGRVMKTRMRPVAVAWGALPRLVRDVAAATGKLVNVEMHGQDTELDRSLLEVLKDPLSHMIRNCVDHGLETPDVRVAAGKAPTGTITLRSRHSGGQVHIEVSDDGRGIQVEKVRARALANGIVTADEAHGMDEETLLALIFRPGFSTAEAVSNLSGRGVGMDVVKSSVERVGGTVDIRSVVGQGTTIRLKLPLTLAIVPALITLVSERRFCIPQANLIEIVDLMTAEAQTRVERLAGAPLYRLRGQLLPLVPLGNTLAMQGFGADLQGYIVVVEADELRYGIVVDEIQHTEEIVVKPLGAAIKQALVYSGATVLGDGSVALILDVVALGRKGRVATHSADAAERERERMRIAVDEGERRTLLRLDVAGIGLVALDVESVVRIDEARAVDVFTHGTETVFRFQDRVVPLTLLSTGSWQQIVICEHGPDLVGIAVTEVLDVVTQSVKLTRGLGASWSEGMCFVLGQPTAMLDLSRLPAAGSGR
jgi:two-component system chemotaxis sensor kinase CheA